MTFKPEKYDNRKKKKKSIRFFFPDSSDCKMTNSPMASLIKS